ncbi:MAG: flagellar protein FlaG [Gammaproteobacteria bacterium]|jgi:flagellar protein FlaG|nr:flagellar protein FlaG [Gammaproteobacteria bacterium]
MDAFALTAQLPTPAAKPVSPAAADARPAAGGKSLPVDGKNAPPPPRAPEIEIPEVSIEEAVAQIQTYIAESQRDLQFRVDEASGRTVVSVFDSQGQLIRQIPSAEVLSVAARLQEQGLNLLDQSV